MTETLLFTVRASSELITQRLARKFDQITCQKFEISLKRSGRTIVGPWWIAKYKVPLEKSLDFIKALVEEKKAGTVKLIKAEYDGKPSKMETVTVNLPSAYLKALDELVKKSGVWQSRDEAIMTAIKNLLWDYHWLIGKREVNA